MNRLLADSENFVREPKKCGHYFAWETLYAFILAPYRAEKRPNLANGLHNAVRGMTYLLEPYWIVGYDHVVALLTYLINR